MKRPGMSTPLRYCVASVTTSRSSGAIHGCYARSFGSLRGNCSLKVNGVLQTPTATGVELKSGTGNLTIVSAATLSGGGSTVDVQCRMGDNTTSANVNLALVKIDALN
jgi:hypothetical protein